MQRIFQPPEYHTPADLPVSMCRRLLPNRVSFYYDVLRIVLQARHRVLHGQYGEQELTASSEDTVNCIEKCGGRVHVTGLEHLYSNPNPVVFISNHMSTLETFVLPGLIGPAKPVTFVVKESLLTQPLFGHIMRAQHPIAVTRKNPREDLRKVLEDGVRILCEEKRSIVVFPQTTRVFKFSPAQFNSLGIKLAVRANVEVVPVALRTDFWGNGKLIKEFGPVGCCKEVSFAFGKSIKVTKASQHEAYAAVVDFIRGRLLEWGVPCETEAAAEPQSSDA